MIVYPWKRCQSRTDVVVGLLRRIGVAALVGVVAVAGSFVVSGNTPTFVVVPVDAFVVYASSAALVAVSIQTLGYLGDQLAFALSFALTVALLTAVAWVGFTVGRQAGIRFVAAIGAGALIWVVTALLTGDPLVALAATLPAFAVGDVLGFGLVAYLVGRTRTTTPGESMSTPSEARRLAEQARARQFDTEDIPGPENTVARVWLDERLDDGAVRVAGHAYAGTRGIERVEVSPDRRTTGTDTEGSEPLGETGVLGERDAWRQWQYTWTPSRGEHTVVVCATDGDGTRQPREERSPLPSGTSVLVETTISV